MLAITLVRALAVLVPMNTEDGGTHRESARRKKRKAHTMGTNYITDAAREARAAFTTDTRPDGSRYTKNTDDAPEWVRDAVRDAHGEVLPDDRIFDLAHDACEWIFRGDTIENMFDEVRHYFADGAIDAYNADRLAWVASSNYRAALVDEVHDDYGAERGDLMDQIAAGQYEEAARIFDYMATAIEERADEIEGAAMFEDIAEAEGVTA